MKLALLGTDSDVLALAAAASAVGHEIVWLGDVRQNEISHVRSLANSHVAPAGAWETLLDRSTADAVIVGRGEANEDECIERLKRLVAGGVPVLVVHPAAHSVLTYYELDMTSREVGGVLRHYNPVVGHPKLEELAELIRGQHETTGRILQIACTREVADGSREHVISGLTRDAELLSFLAGDIHRVSAIGPKSESESFGSLQVQLESAGPATLRWSATPQNRATERVRVSLIGERGSIEWTQSSVAASGHSAAEYSLKLADDAPQAMPFDAPAHAIRGLAAAIEQPTPAAWQENSGRYSTWPTATRAMEIVDAAELSLQKGRTVEVHQQKLTEQLAFRGTMAAFGCGLMLLVTLAVIVVGIVGGVESLLQEKLIQGWAVVLLIVLGGFLSLQVVPFLGRKHRHEAAHEADDAI